MNMKYASWISLSFVLLSMVTAWSNEYQVAVTGSDANEGSVSAPFRTIQHAADVAQPGDIITVHKGVYRERVAPPRGGTSDTNRIVYQAAPDEKVVITGAEPIKEWVKVKNETWRATVPNSFFGNFNPYSDLIHGDWFGDNGRNHHTGCVYLNGDWFIEAAHYADVLRPVGPTPLWFAKVDGDASAAANTSASSSGYLVNLESFHVGATTVHAENSAAKQGTQLAGCAEGGQCVGYIGNGDWLRYDGVDFGNETEEVEFRAAAQSDCGVEIELHLDSSTGELLGVCEVGPTGDWQKWQDFTAKIKPTSGVKNLCLVFKPYAPAPIAIPQPAKDTTDIYAQFPGVDPNEANVEINVRQTVFTPAKVGINYITVRGFDLRDAATNWAPPTAGQIGVITAYWCKGWIIENNEISYSKCSGVALGKYSDEWDNKSADSAEGYVATVNRALAHGWNKETVGSHIVRHNLIHHCEQTGVVGSLGCSFSVVTGNEIHDIHVRNLFGGAEMAGIKFHGGIDVQITHNHIYRCGDLGGIWLDWMGQGAQVTGNFVHDCSQCLFFEMQHGPILVANNILLSGGNAFNLNSQGVAFAYNLIEGAMGNNLGDNRITPFLEAHSTKMGGMYPAHSGDSGDDRFYNNIFAANSDLSSYDKTALPCFADGNVFLKGAKPSKFDKDPLTNPDFDAGVQVTQKSDGWYLTLAGDASWRNDVKRVPVTTALLGKAKVPNCAFENPDGSPIGITTDYFGNLRNAQNPFPGPFEDLGHGIQTIKVWPVMVR